MSEAKGSMIDDDAAGKPQSRLAGYIHRATLMQTRARGMASTLEGLNASVSGAGIGLENDTADKPQSSGLGELDAALDSLDEALTTIDTITTQLAEQIRL